MSWENLTEDIQEMFSSYEGVPDSNELVPTVRLNYHVLGFNRVRAPAGSYDRREAARDYGRRNRERLRLYKKEWRERNRERLRERRRENQRQVEPVPVDQQRCVAAPLPEPLPRLPAKPRLIWIRSGKKFYALPAFDPLFEAN